MHQSYLCGYKTCGMVAERGLAGHLAQASEPPLYVSQRGGGNMALLFKWTILPTATSPLYASFLILPSFLHPSSSLSFFLSTLPPTSIPPPSACNPMIIGHRNSDTCHTGPADEGVCVCVCVNSLTNLGTARKQCLNNLLFGYASRLLHLHWVG
jgi:hypothetical protein